MKRSIRTFLCGAACAAAAALSPAVSYATLIAYEPFNYAAGGTVNGQNGGAGWSGAWGQQGATAIPAGSNSIVANSLTGPVGLPTSGNSALVTGEFGTLQMARPFPNVAGTAGTTTWYSFLGQRLGSNAGGTNWVNNPFPRGANMGLFDTEAVAQGGTNNERVGVGNSTTVNGVDAAHFDEWSLIPQGAGTAREGPASHSPKWSELAWAVVRIDHIGDATVADSVWMWLNPNPLGGEPLTANAAVEILSGDANSRDLSNVDFVRPFAGNLQNSGNAATQRPFAVIALDEIRLGTTWDDMRAVPEPASTLLAAVSALALAAFRKRALVPQELALMTRRI